MTTEGETSAPLPTPASATAPTAAPTPAAPEPTPSAVEPTPSAVEPTPAAPQPAPQAAQPAPQPAAQAAQPASQPASPAPAIAHTGTLVPLYTPPSDASWKTVAAAKLAHPSVPIIAVVNPANGPGSRLDAGYTDGIAALVRAGVSVLGYVSTSYTRRSETAVRADIDTWRQWYPQTSGIFFDEQSNNAGGEDYYRRVATYARSKAFTFTVGNPGTDSAPTYVGTVDMILVYESAGQPSAARMSGWHGGFDRTNFGIIPYGVSALDATFLSMAKRSVGYIYVTNDALPNPWDTIPPYFSDLVANLATTM